MNQIVGYIMSEDLDLYYPAMGGLCFIMKVERDEILEELMAVYIDARV